MAKLISKTYGDALFTLSVEENKTDDFVEEINALLVILAENPEFKSLLTHPRIPVNEKVDVIKEVFSGCISEELVGFFALIVKKGRYANIDEILQYFLDAAKELKGIGVAYVITPFVLEDSQKKAVEDKLLETTNYNTMEMNYSIDESLIGGMQIRIGDRVVDSSIRTKILKMQQDLMKIQL